MQLTAIIGELSDILGKVTTDENGENLDEHTHVFVHKGHTHTVTHNHPHHADHHHHDDWTDSASHIQPERLQTRTYVLITPTFSLFNTKVLKHSKHLVQIVVQLNLGHISQR